MNQGRRKRALLIDDDPDVLGLLRSLCLEVGVEVDEASDGAAALERARLQPPDLILLDMVLPDAEGPEIALALRSEARLATVPIIMVSARRDQSSKVAALEAGANDYIVKPFDLQEIVARIRAQLRHREAYEKLERNNIELRMANSRLEELATTDELTGLSNARYFRERLDEEFLRAERYETPLALVMADLDGFKSVNDTHGHQAGDRLLAQLAQRLGAQARATDILCRYGGDEFAFLLPHTQSSEAELFAQRLIDRVANAPLRLPNGSIAGIALSCGVACWPESVGINASRDLFVVADQALYRAKESGKGRVVLAPAHQPQEKAPKADRKPWPRRPNSPSGAPAALRGEG